MELVQPGSGLLVHHADTLASDRHRRETMDSVAKTLGAMNLGFEL